MKQSEETPGVLLVGSPAKEEAASTDTRPTAILQVSGVSKRFGRTLALDRFSIDVRPGEVHALVGHNGSGKSTLVKVLAGYHQPEQGGEARVDGAAFSLGDARAAQAAGLRFVHQDLGLVDTFNAVDNVYLGRDFPTTTLGRIDWAVARRETRTVLAALGYDIRLSTLVHKLPLVERTAIAIARALQPGGTEPRVLVLDEPTAALPGTGIDELFKVIDRLRSSGIGILYISHHLDEIFEIGDRVTVLRDGRLVDTRNTQGLTEDELVELMVGSVVSTTVTRSTTRHAQAAVMRIRDLSSETLHHVDLDVAPGEIVGVAGVAGSGRDELASVLFGGTARKGSVAVDDVEVPHSRPDRSIKHGLGLLPADRGTTGLVATLTVRENLTLPRLASSVSGLFLDRRAEAREALTWLERLDVVPRNPALRIDQLSGGNQQKVVLGRWLRADPKVLILDEPTQGVDVGAIARIYAMVREFAANGTAFIVCSSDTDELVALCDRVVVLRRGEVVGELRDGTLQRELIDRMCLADIAGTNEEI